eukprot:SAG31_NODE_28556_length_408_cov_0.977346_1_plen_107_part_10
MDSELMTLALQSSQRVQLEVAQHFEEMAMQQAGPGRADALHTASDAAKTFLRNAVLLYHKGGQVSTALDICFRAQLHEELRRVTDKLGKDTDPALMAQCADHFMRHV